MPSASSCPTYDECVRGYVNCEKLLICFGCVGVLASIALNVADYSSRVPVLNWSEARVQAAKKATLLGADAQDSAELRLLAGEDDESENTA
jgi:hypothetical protein